MNDHDNNLPKYKSFTVAKEESRDQEIDYTTQDQESTRPLCNDDPSLAADSWRSDIGVNVIPADTRIKWTNIQWKQYQDSSIPDWQHQKWKLEGAFSKGIAIIPGNIWHRKDKKGLFFVSIDVDKENGIKELCTRNGKTISLQKMAEKFLVEQHKDNLDRAHISFYSPIPFPQKTSDSVLGLEVKGLGEHGIVFCSPSIHKDGAPYEIIGTAEPVVLSFIQATELIQHINLICIRYGVQYLGKCNNLIKVKPMIRTLKVDPAIRIPEGQRHTTLISAADSLLLRYLDKKTEQQLKDFFNKINIICCDPEPLPESEIENIWSSAMVFSQEIRREKETNKPEETKQEEKIGIIKEASEAIQSNHKFVTIEETREILYYNNGRYIKGGEVLIEKEAEALFGYQLSNQILATKGTYHAHATFEQNCSDFVEDVKSVLVDNQQPI